MVPKTYKHIYLNQEDIQKYEDLVSKGVISTPVIAFVKSAYYEKIDRLMFKYRLNQIKKVNNVDIEAWSNET